MLWCKCLIILILDYAHRRQVFLGTHQRQVSVGIMWFTLNSNQTKGIKEEPNCNLCQLVYIMHMDHIWRWSYSPCKAGKVGCSCFPLAPRTTLSPTHRGHAQLPWPLLMYCRKSTDYIFAYYNSFLEKKHIVEMFWKIL